MFYDFVVHKKIFSRSIIQKNSLAMCIWTARKNTTAFLNDTEKNSEVFYMWINMAAPAFQVHRAKYKCTIKCREPSVQCCNSSFVRHVWHPFSSMCCWIHIRHAHGGNSPWHAQHFSNSHVRSPSRRHEMVYAVRWACISVCVCLHWTRHTNTFRLYNDSGLTFSA